MPEDPHWGQHPEGVILGATGVRVLLDMGAATPWGVLPPCVVPWVTNKQRAHGGAFV